MAGAGCRAAHEQSVTDGCCRLPTAVRSLGGSWQRSWFRKLGFAFLFRFALLLWLILYMATGAKGSTFKWNLAVVKTKM